MTSTLVPPPAGAPARSSFPRGPGSGRHGRVVVGVDGSEGCKDALRWAARQAKLMCASLDVLLSWEVPPVPYGVWTSYDASDEARETLDAVVNEVLGVAENGGPLEIGLRKVVVEGQPGPVLLAAAETADLLVVGTRGHGHFAGLLLGSVSQHCVAHALCPVVVVPHGWSPRAADGRKGPVWTS